jgi:MipA family protein
MSCRTSLRHDRPDAGRRPLHVALVALAAIVSLGAVAPCAAQQSSGRSFTGVVGLAVVAVPEYSGSEETRVLPVPLVQVEYRNRLYIGGSQGGASAGIGAFLLRRPTVTWDVGLTGSIARDEDRGDALAGMGKREAAAYAATGLSYRMAFVQASANAAVGLAEEQGSFARIGLGAEVPVAGRLTAGLSTGATFANARHMAFEYGVTAEQSARRQALLDAGDPRLDGIDVAAYAPSGGLKELNVGASLAWMLTSRTRLVMFARGSRLSDEAAASPIVRSRTETVTGAAIGLGF